MFAASAGAQKGGGECALAPMRAPQPDETDQAQPNRKRDNDPQDDDLFHGTPQSNDRRNNPLNTVNKGLIAMRRLGAAN